MNDESLWLSMYINWGQLIQRNARMEFCRRKGILRSNLGLFRLIFKSWDYLRFACTRERARSCLLSSRTFSFGAKRPMCYTGYFMWGRYDFKLSFSAFLALGTHIFHFIFIQSEPHISKGRLPQMSVDFN